MPNHPTSQQSEQGSQTNSPTSVAAVMPRIIKDLQIVPDTWQLLTLQEGCQPADVVVPEGKIIVPKALQKYTGFEVIG